VDNPRITFAEPKSNSLQAVAKAGRRPRRRYLADDLEMKKNSIKPMPAPRWGQLAGALKCDITELRDPCG
jgi:hypothetical protein